jgi:SAM-dependent methyltransferase
MTTTWDYSNLAAHYLTRPDYAPAAIDQMCRLTGAGRGTEACDIGAGSGHLTKELLRRGMNVTAIEPNAEMRKVGEAVTADSAATWGEGTGEQTGQPARAFDLVTFGSSFNTTDRPSALRETARILKPGGWFVCLWNHRDLNDPLQAEVEDFIKSSISGYGYGVRREDQTPIIVASGLFAEPQYIEASYVATVKADDYVEAWRSHGTLARQAGAAFAGVIVGIEQIVRRQGGPLRVGYTTRLWAARLK